MQGEKREIQKMIVFFQQTIGSILRACARSFAAGMKNASINKMHATEAGNEPSSARQRSFLKRFLKEKVSGLPTGRMPTYGTLARYFYIHSIICLISSSLGSKTATMVAVNLTLHKSASLPRTVSCSRLVLISSSIISIHFKITSLYGYHLPKRSSSHPLFP